MRVSHARGVGLVELLVALTILAVGVLGVASTALVAARRLRAAELRQEAVLTAAGIADSITFAGTPVAAGAVRIGPLDFSWAGQAAGAGAEHVTIRVASGAAELLRFNTVVTAAPPAAQP